MTNAGKGGGTGTNGAKIQPRKATSSDVLAEQGSNVTPPPSDDPFRPVPSSDYSNSALFAGMQAEADVTRAATTLWDRPNDDGTQQQLQSALTSVSNARQHIRSLGGTHHPRLELATERLHDAAEATSEQRRPAWAGGTENDPRPFFRRDTQPNGLTAYTAQFGLNADEATEQVEQFETELRRIATDQDETAQHRRQQVAATLLAHRGALNVEAGHAAERQQADNPDSAYNQAKNRLLSLRTELLNSI